MKNKQKTNLIILGIILILIVSTFFLVKSKPKNETTEELAKCIGKKSTLYIQVGCHVCTEQEKLFRENYQYLTKIDCFYEPTKCEGITGTPTWKIDGKKYLGIQSIEKLKELTGC